MDRRHATPPGERGGDSLGPHTLRRVPYAGFPALVAAAVGCGAFYRSCEPLQLVLLPEQGAARFLARKVLAAWRNYFLFAVPYAAVIVLRHPTHAGWPQGGLRLRRWRCFMP